MNKEIVANNIKSAFAGVTLGAGIGLWEAQAIDDYETQEVQKRNRDKDEKEEWYRLSCDDLQRCHSSLSFFDAEGMKFHLPAYIVASLENNVDDPLFHLTQLDDYTKSKLIALNHVQRQAIVTYLEWCFEQEEYEFEHPTICMALREYWKT
ncbi:hypothetical protein HRE53_32780 (plasmid) [Acaryochloris sp. 'Moss Beach']|uniref:DUF6714 family protein n=1 Tax=Acaryochloris sp. 'Moss Beach' TaxID=2740837 RepID=UPI001F2A391B|nr:DUF6714 family protein [Acaryochloris sp. 'Moss Beach']UJB73410.1 hypothetical protein HRE53_32780 [Acaryochloris sp. 'Moss Beach']